MVLFGILKIKSRVHIMEKVERPLCLVFKFSSIRNRCLLHLKITRPFPLAQNKGHNSRTNARQEISQHLSATFSQTGQMIPNILKPEYSDQRRWQKPSARLVLFLGQGHYYGYLGISKYSKYIESTCKMIPAYRIGIIVFK